ncbi:MULTISPECIES: ABC transporter permease [Flavobacterium]|uniref:FtsX-like permease family protein n=2 Tax=Flavobacterium TaxID=237 RepID=A0AA94F3H1_9FLAO|nr:MULTISPECIES: ABC transporter permease [Flavobacterium]OXA81223.1 ABC transporter permease [Flavobacterium columnare] [Flavobacterium columnare NBRC 100251 = ATCC 23463]AMA50100.1 ABC transporter permease [Flavobacterium covae]AND64374.1 ABC transporter permease [Flavobacterium covae]MCH4829311.1 ABC transporter permease [Flavobacterium columnare]MCH4834087.1 ABC transporter permease [Flavobacterium columnare]
MIIYLRLLQESFSFAVNALRNNKLRTLLSLLGVTIGIFSIITILSAVDSLDQKIKKDVGSLDNSAVYLFKYSFSPTDVPDWKIEQFPKVTYDEYRYLKENTSKIEGICYQYFTKRETVKFEDKTMTNVGIVPCTYEYIDINKLDFLEGRFFNEQESNSSTGGVVIGAEVAQTLFDGMSAIGKEIRIYGQRFKVFGVLRKVGNRMINFGENPDGSVYLNLNKVRALYSDNNEKFMPVIIIKPLEGVSEAEVKGEIVQKMRTYRGLSHGQINNFFLNFIKGATDMLDGLISQMNLIGWIIAGFSLLVGGFGIANIMFVSVKERTNLIGIQKSLGAKNRFILLQFLFEAIVLCLIGGVIGIIFVWLVTLGLTQVLDFDFVLSFSNILFGTFLAIIIGLIAGILPAISASKLDPVEAIRSGM